MNGIVAATTALLRELLSGLDAVVSAGSLDNARRAVSEADRRRRMHAAVGASLNRSA